MKKVLLCVLLAVSAFLAIANIAVPREKADVFYPGEELVYKVKYSFIRVGTLRLVNEGLVDYQGGKYFKLRIYIDSASGIPFITLHDIYETYVDSSSAPIAFFAWEKKGDHTLETDYLFDYDNKKATVKVRKVYKDTTIVQPDEILPLDRVYRDVLALLYFARVKSGENYQNIVIPTFVLNGKDSCYFNEVGKIRELKYQGKKVPAYYIQGRVKFIGIAGIKDDFEGWFSLDRQRVPIKAKMKAFFGSVTIELEEARNWLGEKYYRN